MAVGITMGDAPPWGGGRVGYGRVGHGPLRTFSSSRPASPGPSRRRAPHPARPVPRIDSAPQDLVAAVTH